MEHSKDPISVRIARINAEILGKTAKLDHVNLLARENLLDVLQALYEECCLENLQKYDSNIAQFVDRYKDKIKVLKQLRVNLADFEIRNVVGRGHFGEVHLVKEKQTGDLYAMKTLRKFDSEASNTSFDEERNIMAFSNSHWHTSLQYAFQDSTYLFFIMEYHPGGDLLGLLYRQGGTLPESAATFYIAELVLALEDLHKMGYVHRDIKPDNILLDRCGHLKLADFGSAAKLNKDCMVTSSLPAGTPDYIAPEVLQCLDNKSEKNVGYGASCDFWSLGILAYELTIGSTPFVGQNSTSIYSKIMNHSNALKFPPDVVLSQAYVLFVKSLITDVKSRMNRNQIRNHVLFSNTHFDTLRDQVPPYVPKIKSVDDTSNFSDVPTKRKNPTIENFKKRTQFSGRNLPFVGFTFTHDSDRFDGNLERKILAKDELVESLKSEVESLRRKLVKQDEFDQERNCLENKMEEKSRKVEVLENLRDKLERDVASSIAECAALKRTLELERKDRCELEKKALDLIKGAKQKWETAEKNKVEALTLELEQHKEKICQLTTTNKMLKEQVQHALKLEGKHKESLEKVHHLSRRSVIGLESRLEKVTSETHVTISELQRKLTEEMHQKALIEKKYVQLRDKELCLNQKVAQSEKEFDKWQVRIDEAETVIKQLNEQVTALENDVEKISEYREEIANLQGVLDDTHKTVKDLENQNMVLQRESQLMERYKKEMEELKKTVLKIQNDRKVEELESQLLEEREKCLVLKKQLQESENILTENQELKELRTKYWRIEKELGNCKIDKRILERELKDAEAEVKKLNDALQTVDKNIADTRQMHEAALLELSKINESISLELMKAKDGYKNLQDKLNNEKEMGEEKKLMINQLKEMIRTKDEQVNVMTLENDALKKEKATLENCIEQYESETSKFVNMVETLDKEKREIRDELEKSKREMENTSLNLAALREACSLLENQVIEYEQINASFETKHAALNSNTEKLIQDLCKAKQEIQEARKLANEEKSLKLLAETKTKRLHEDIDCLKTECASYKEQCMEYKQYSSNLAEELTLSEEKISELEVTVKSYQRQIDDLRSENRTVKQEVSDYLTQLNKVKEINYKFKSQLSVARDETVMLMQKSNELERVLNEKSHYFREREMKSDSTIKQQIKLIDYLQSKIDEQNNKKRTLTEVLFGSAKKENHPPLSMAMNYKDLEMQLLKEKQTNKQLQEEIYRLKAATMINENDKLFDGLKLERHKSEILSPKSKVAMRQIVNSPSKQKNDLYRHNSLQRMHHNIPHRYDSRLCTKSSMKCAGCSDPISLGRSVQICLECNIHVHAGCAKHIPNTCGLPQMFAKHYKDSLEPKNEETAETPKGNEVVNVEGWIKVPGKSNAWEKRYACLTDTAINIYSGPPKEQNSTLVQHFPLKPEDSHGKVILEPLPSEIGVPVANSDLAFVLKVEVAPNTTCWPPKCLIFLTLSAKEKDKWFLALQKIYCHDFDKPKPDNILIIPEDLEVNCIVDLTENINVFGTERGLYSYYEKNFVYIDGLAKVHHISLMPTTGNALMIAHEKRKLISCDLNHLINLTQCAQCTKPTLKFKEINVQHLNGFHILQVSLLASQQKICTATSKQLIILSYDLEENEFVPERILDTAEPTSCALFTANSLIVGANKFFEIDLATFGAEEFLDVSDAKLKQAERCYKMGSYPIAIMQISKNPIEYLLCFNEFSIFVDEYGRSSRNAEIKSTRLTVAFHYGKPYLYVVQFAAVEILKIGDDTCNVNGDAAEFTRLELDKCRYVGCNRKGVYVLAERQLKFVDACKILDDDASSSVSGSTENDDRFSFTSSMVQSLDGHLSDGESGADYQKRVRFSQKDF